MKRAHANWIALCLFALSLANAAAAADRGDVPYVPTPFNVVEAMLKLGQVRQADYLIDLGCGDGRIVITAAKQHGTHGFGVDLDGALVATARSEAKRQGVADKVAFYQRNIFDTDFSKATVLTLYLLPDVNLRLRPAVLQLRPGTRVVSHDFSMGDWPPDEQLTIDVPNKSYGPPVSKLYLWIVPAKADGKWLWKVPVVGGEQPIELTLAQNFQTLTGSVLVGGRTSLLVNPVLRGDQISFSVVDDFMPRHDFAGRIQGDNVEGSYRVQSSGAQKPVQWTAHRGGAPK